MSVHPLHRAAQLGHLEALRRELAAGADPDTRHSEYPDRPDIPLRGGARLDMTRMAALPGGAPPYITKVDAAGGWKKYEQPHRKRLTTMFTRVLFPHLPIGAISNIVYFWAHVGFY